MAFGGGTKPAYAVPKPQHVKTSHSVSRPSAPKPKAGISRPTAAPAASCCGKRA